ncbi:MAG: ElyC/SanA/YdcF family protein [Armatimonadota bacterium]|nr:YdcF family protein [bacterium]
MKRVKPMAKHPKWKRPIRTTAALVLAAAAVLGGARAWVAASARGWVYTDVEAVPKCRVALVLGAKVHRNGKLSTLLRDRVDAAIALYKAGKVQKLLMSGDNRFSHYNEPKRMCEYAVAHGVHSEDVAMDFAGRRTYDSIYRAKHIFGLDKIIIVSQGFHVDRAVFLSKRIGVDAYGFAADKPEHRNMRAIVREMPACVNAILDVYFLHPHPVMEKRERI